MANIHCKDCIKFRKSRKGRNGAVYGTCVDKDPYWNIGNRSGSCKGCKEFIKKDYISLVEMINCLTAIDENLPFDSIDNTDCHEALYIAREAINFIAHNEYFEAFRKYLRGSDK